jgi:monovalent cation:H+ antiporter-2, CPA2 family
MAAHSMFFRDIAYVFVAALAGGLLARRLRQPLILGYVFGGILVGPFTPGPRIVEVKSFELLAELGVILLMYSIGIEFSIRDLLRVKWVALIGGPLGIVLSIILSLGVGHLLGWSVPQSITIGAVISVASTMVLSRLLMDRGELHSPHGSVMIAITLVEDMAVVVMTVLLPNLQSFVGGELLQIGAGLGKSLLLLIPVVFAAVKLVPPIMNRVARTKSDELYLLVALAIGFATAALTEAVGLSLALGAFLAGLIISESEHSHQTLAQLLPIRDAFVALFFVTIGALIDPRNLLAQPALLAAIIALVIFGKFVIWFLVVVLFRYRISTALLVGIGLTQIGEFSFILVQVAKSSGIVGLEVYNATLAAALVTILINAALLRFLPGIIMRRRVPSDVPQPPHEHSSVLICGYGRLGSVIGAALESFSISFSVVELDPDLITDLRRRGIRAVFGDASIRSILQQAGAATAPLVVVTLADRDRGFYVTRAIRELNTTATVITRIARVSDGDAMRSAGANEVVQPESEAATTLVRRALHHLNVPEKQSGAYLESIRNSMDALLEETRSARTPRIADLEVRSPEMENRSLRDLDIRGRFGVTVISVEHNGDTTFNPGADVQIHLGDRLRIIGVPDQISTLTMAVTDQQSNESTKK